VQAVCVSTPPPVPTSTCPVGKYKQGVYFSA
jgi:hypothetical protein